MRRTIASIAAALTIASAAIAAPLPATEADAAPVPSSTSVTFLERIAGPDRFATSLEISQQLPYSYSYTDETVFLASATTFADALAVAPLAAGGSRRILLTGRDELPWSVEQHLRQITPGSIYVVGGTSAISDAVLQQAHAATYAPVHRIGGTDRVGTSLLVAGLMQQSAPDAPVWIASGTQFADALVAAPVAARERAGIVLAVHGSDAGSTQAWRDRVLPYVQGRDVRIAGGRAAVSESDAQWLESVSASVDRFGGADRWQTALAIDVAFRHLLPSAEQAVIASGERFPDALGATVLAVHLGAPLFVSPRACDATVSAGIRDAMAAVGATRVVAVGGASVLSADAAWVRVCPGPQPTPTQQHMADQFGTFPAFSVSGTGSGRFPVPPGMQDAVLAIEHQSTTASTATLLDTWGGPWYGSVRVEASETTSQRLVVVEDVAGATWEDPPVTQFEVQSDGSWTVRWIPIAHMPVLTSSLSGAGDGVVLVGAGTPRVRLAVSASSWNAHTYTPTAPYPRSSGIGGGSAPGSVDADLRVPGVVEITSDGTWSISVR